MVIPLFPFLGQNLTKATKHYKILVKFQKQIIKDK